MFQNMQGIRTIKGRHYLISTVNLVYISQGFETMVFECSEEGRILTGVPLHEKRYSTFTSAVNHHREIMNLSDVDFAKLIQEQ